MKLILLGAPGAGKGTQASIISQRLNIPTISTGNMLRAAAQNDTPADHEVKACIDAGKLVPDDLIIEIVTERLAQPDCANGYILDGVPRTIAQAEKMKEAGIEIDVVLSFEVSDEEIVSRMAGRRTCLNCGATYHVVNAAPKIAGKCDNCGSDLVQRADDKPETVQRRLELYREKTEPLKGYYAEKGILKTLHNRLTIAENTKKVFELLGID